jgi:hypothetical protein
MSQQAATITSLSIEFEMVKAMQAKGREWDKGYRPHSVARRWPPSSKSKWRRPSIAISPNSRPTRALPDRRNGHYKRHLLTTLSDIELRVPLPDATAPPGCCAPMRAERPRSTGSSSAGFVLRLWTCKAGETLLGMLGGGIGAGTVRVAICCT